MGEIKPKKDEGEDAPDAEGKELSYEDKLKNCSQIADPMASKKLTKKIYKLIKKGMLIEMLFYNQKKI